MASGLSKLIRTISSRDVHFCPFWDHSAGLVIPCVHGACADQSRAAVC
jgi:hypothetical protein